MSTSANDFGSPVAEQPNSGSVDSQPTQTPQAPSSLDSAEIPAQTIVPTADAPSTRSIRQRKRPSQRRINANRQNAKRSTGPRTARGKKAVSRNAMTHGLLAREVVILDGCGAEKKEDFAALQSQLSEHYKSVGAMEEMWVQKIAVLLWRQARVCERRTARYARGLI